LLAVVNVPVESAEGVYERARAYVGALGSVWCRPADYDGTDSELHLAVRSAFGCVLEVDGAARLQPPEFVFKIVFSGVRLLRITNCFGGTGTASLVHVEGTHLKRFSVRPDSGEAAVIVEASHCFLSDLDPRDTRRTGVWSPLLLDVERAAGSPRT